MRTVKADAILFKITTFSAPRACRLVKLLSLDQNWNVWPLDLVLNLIGRQKKIWPIKFELEIFLSSRDYSHHSLDWNGNV